MRVRSIRALLYNLCMQIIQIQIMLSPFRLILIKRICKTFSLRRVAKDVTLWLISWHKRYDLMPQIFEVIADENMWNKQNELEFSILLCCLKNLA